MCIVRSICLKFKIGTNQRIGCGSDIMNSMNIIIPLHFISLKKILQTMLWPCYARVNSHQRWKQTRFRVCFHLWCELANTMNVTEWQVSWNSCMCFFNQDTIINVIYKTGVDVENTTRVYQEGVSKGSCILPALSKGPQWD